MPISEYVKQKARGANDGDMIPPAVGSGRVDMQSKFNMAFAFAALVLGVAPMAAQIAGAGSIQGVVSDASGAVVPQANVTAVDVKRGIRTERQSTSAGFFNLSPLPP